MIARIDKIILEAKKLEDKYAEALKRVHPRCADSASNLLHYRSLRMKDISILQRSLSDFGITSLAHSEGHILASLTSCKKILLGLIGKKATAPAVGLSIKKGQRNMRANSKNLLGYRSKGRRTRIMVTLPAEAGTNYKLVYDLIANGMNCARINCAHDDEVVWKSMIENIKKASDKLKKKCIIAMDLGGPKIRTGPLVPGPKVRKMRPEKDARGQIVQPLTIWVGPEECLSSPLLHLPLGDEQTQELKEGDELCFRDARFKKRRIIIGEKKENGFYAHVPKTTYIETGQPVYKTMEGGKPFAFIGEIPPTENVIVLKEKDILRLDKGIVPGQNARYNEKGEKLSNAHISCTSPEVFDSVEVGEAVLFDDGKISGKVVGKTSDNLHIELILIRDGTGKLRADKGINFPASNLQLSGLTEKDRKDLDFIVNHAHVVSLSFVNNPGDVRQLLRVLRRKRALKALGVILKIETQNGFNELTDILLEAMRMYPVGVMVARGDMAIECGWENMGRIQEEILALCRAAHVPDIWATQVLDNLAKKGIPSRAELTDATMAQRADCVMLNKGPFIIQAIQLLDTILKDMLPHQEKNLHMLPALEKADKHR